MVLLVIAFLTVAPQAANPEYEGWSPCKPGSWVRLTMKVSGTDLAIEFKWTLLELSKEKAVVERKSSAAGQKDSTEKEDVPSDRDPHPIKIEAQGDEEIEVAGKKLKCHWVEGSQGDKIKKTKQWMSKDVPGGLVKVELTTDDGTVMKMIATAWERK